MKIPLLFLTNLFFLFIFAPVAHSSDIYAEYQITIVGRKPSISKMYSKNGDLRTEVDMEIGGSKMNAIILILKSKPEVAFVLNSLNKTYTETRNRKNSTIKNYVIKVLGNEKVGKYNTTHVRMSSEGKLWDIWFTKDLPVINLPVTTNDETSNKRMLSQLKSKGITGTPVKVVFLKSNTSIATMTMQLTKFEQKNLHASLFTLPAGYKKSSATINPEKMKNMTPEQKKELMMKMLKEQQLKH